ncbi:MAG TPA: SGNH/GDSL hydrolase family protein [Candidatus Saccharimonadales bacterium]|nr:SGNH/GDSL hydrolase family protein [Candidatus Saccharimonadales bacterium]
MRRRELAAAVLVLLAAAPAARAQTVSGQLFEDRNANGVRDPNEPALPGLTVGLHGKDSGGSPFDLSDTTAADGTWSLSPGDGCYLIDLPEPAGWRLTPPRFDLYPSSMPPYIHPVGLPRFGALGQGVARLRSGGPYVYASMGDSIAWNFNVCGYTSSFWYSSQVMGRMACTSPGATLTLDKAAVKGEHTDDLLVNDTNDDNNVFRMMAVQPDLITLSMIGNDLLDVDVSGTPTQSAVNLAVSEILDSRRNLQEALSVLVSEVPGADISLNTLYDNLAYNCPTTASSPFHRQWLPIVGQILRDLAWGQTRRLDVNEAAADFGQQALDGSCSGFSGQICRDIFNFDDIHPTNDGYSLMREKVWEGIGGVSLGSGDALKRSSIPDVDYGLLRRVRRLEPTTWEVRNGGAVSTPQAALDLNDGGATASITLGTGTEEVRFGGFPDWYDEIQIVKVIAGVRYKTSGTVTDDFYRIEASVTGQFQAPAGHNFSTTSWNFYTPIVGGGGPNQPPGNADYPTEALLALPNVPSLREVSATLSKDPVVNAAGNGYDWPPLTRQDLATTQIRVVSAPVAGTAGNDAYTVDLDGAYLDLYGWEKPRPPEITGVDARMVTGGTLEISFDEAPGAQRYNLYAGSLPLPGGYDHGSGAPAGPFCDEPTTAAGSGRLAFQIPAAAQPAGSAYFLVTDHVDDVESPAGHDSAGLEIDRSQSICP